jgi:MFS family permease
LEDFNSDLNAAVHGIFSWVGLTIGLAVTSASYFSDEKNFFWIPTAKVIGSRPCFLISSFGVFATFIWSAEATTLLSLVGARVLGAFLGATTEAFAASITADLFFLHERGWWMGVYMFVQNTGSTLGSIMTGFMITKGWRWHFWVKSRPHCSL